MKDHHDDVAEVVDDDAKLGQRRNQHPHCLQNHDHSGWRPVDGEVVGDALMMKTGSSSLPAAADAAVGCAVVDSDAADGGSCDLMMT